MAFPVLCCVGVSAGEVCADGREGVSLSMAAAGYNTLLLLRFRSMGWVVDDVVVCDRDYSYTQDLLNTEPLPVS